MARDQRQPRKNLAAAQSQHWAAGRPWKRSDILPYGARSRIYCNSHVLESQDHGRDSQQRFRGGRDRDSAGVHARGTPGGHDGVQRRVRGGATAAAIVAPAAATAAVAAGARAAARAAPPAAAAGARAAPPAAAAGASATPPPPPPRSAAAAGASAAPAQQQQQQQQLQQQQQQPSSTPHPPPPQSSEQGVSGERCVNVGRELGGGCDGDNDTGDPIAKLFPPWTAW